MTLIHTRRVAACCLLGWTLAATAYPLDGYDQSGLRRLLGYIHAQEHGPTGARLPKGALLGYADIQLGLPADPVLPDFDTQPADPALQAALTNIFKDRDPSYGVVVVDISNPTQPAWAAVRGDFRQNPGSVGKILVMAGLFDALARAFPRPDDRARILRETLVLGGDWVRGGDEHKVPRWDPVTGDNSFSQVRPEDEFRLGEWLDHMISPSANAAASVVWREAMLIRHFGARYPVPEDERREFLEGSSKTTLGALAQAVLLDPMLAAGLHPDQLRQGSMFTKGGKERVPGVTSHATALELARLLFRLEQGRLVDAWSSLEMKRYLYITKRRYRYVYASELRPAAAYFKSGSLYQCQAEEGFRCGKYMGNVRNYLNSVAIIERADPGEPPRRYLVALLSNVLKVNSAWDHARLGAAIDAVVRTRQSVQVQDSGSSGDIKAAGEG